VFSVRALVARAQTRVIFVDPFFTHVDVREFALATQYQDVGVCALVGRSDNLWQRTNGDQKVVGDAFAEDLYALAEELKRPGLTLPDVRLMGHKARTYHDRFLVIDDDVWHFGHSFNQLGQLEVSMATRLRYPDEIRDWITEDMCRAARFLKEWPVLKARRIQGGTLRRLWDLLINAVSAGSRKLGFGNATAAAP
jgi:hypothetical protein